MDFIFKDIDVEQHFLTCYEFRKDSYFCSFGTFEGYEQSVAGYHDKITTRMSSPEWFYTHIWHHGCVIGQLEFKAFSFKPDYGYVHLVYVVSEYRGSGASSLILPFIEAQLQARGCQGAILSVSRSNERALNYYKKCGWRFLSKNPKHELTDFYEYKFSV